VYKIPVSPVAVPDGFEGISGGELSGGAIVTVVSSVSHLSLSSVIFKLITYVPGELQDRVIDWSEASS